MLHLTLRLDLPLVVFTVSVPPTLTFDEFIDAHASRSLHLPSPLLRESNISVVMAGQDPRWLSPLPATPADVRNIQQQRMKLLSQTLEQLKLVDGACVVFTPERAEDPPSLDERLDRLYAVKPIPRLQQKAMKEELTPQTVWKALMKAEDIGDKANLKRIWRWLNTHGPEVLEVLPALVPPLPKQRLTTLITRNSFAVTEIAMFTAVVLWGLKQLQLEDNEQRHKQEMERRQNAEQAAKDRQQKLHEEKEKEKQAQQKKRPPAKSRPAVQGMAAPRPVTATAKERKGGEQKQPAINTWEPVEQRDPLKEAELESLLKKLKELMQKENRPAAAQWQKEPVRPGIAPPPAGVVAKIPKQEIPPITADKRERLLALIGDLLPYIRYARMTSKTFGSQVATTGLLPIKDTLALFEYIGLREAGKPILVTAYINPLVKKYGFGKRMNPLVLNHDGHMSMEVVGGDYNVNEPADQKDPSHDVKRLFDKEPTFPYICSKPTDAHFVLALPDRAHFRLDAIHVTLPTKNRTAATPLAHFLVFALNEPEQYKELPSMDVTEYEEWRDEKKMFFVTTVEPLQPLGGASLVGSDTTHQIDMDFTCVAKYVCVKWLKGEKDNNPLVAVERMECYGSWHDPEAAPEVDEE